MGRNCTISHGVTLGQGLVDDSPADADTPVIGDRVWMGPGAVIAGPILVGSDAAVGANSVVLRDVPPRGVVLGVPARVVSHKGSFAQVYYRGMNDDPERRAALEDPQALTEADPG
jgi:serine O-acetyltransferase